VQVDPIKPTLTAPGTKRLNLEFDELLSSFAFKFSLRRYTLAKHTDVDASPFNIAVSATAPAYPLGGADAKGGPYRFAAAPW
jgi:hypothetical protein